MAKPEWGIKRTCPKCGTRFYDLGQNPVVCISCENEWIPEPILKSKQPQLDDVPSPKKDQKADKIEKDIEDDDLDTAAEEDLVDLELDDDNDDVLSDVDLEDDDDVSNVIDTPVKDEKE